MVYIAVSGVDCEGEYILGVYGNKNDARKVIREHINNCDYTSIKKINEDDYEIGGYKYLAVRAFDVI